MSNPKLEFFRFKLNHKTEQYKTFRQFMVENGKATRRHKIIQSLQLYISM